MRVRSRDNVLCGVGILFSLCYIFRYVYELKHLFKSQAYLNKINKLDL